MAWTCTDCGEEHRKEHGLYLHKRRTLHSCEHCKHHPQFHCADDVRRHMLTHNLYPCTVCTRGFFLPFAVRSHMRDVHGLAMPDQTTPHIPPALRQLPTFVSELKGCSTTEDFLRDKVEPDGVNTANCKRVIDDIVDFLQHRTGLNVAEVFKGGSLAKGTGIKLKNDIDLAVFLNDTTVETLKSGMDDRLRDLKERLMHGSNFNDRLKFTGFTRHSIQFQLRCSSRDTPHDVDLLPAVDLLQTGTKESVYRKMKRDERSRAFYSVCLAKLQVQFVKHRPARVKSLIRLIKHWKVTENLPALKSYSVELLVIKLWQKWREPESFDLTKRMKDVLRELRNIGTMKIGWPDEYDIDEYGGFPRDKVVIMDPANPYGNTAKMMNDDDVRRIEQKARETIDHLDFNY